MNAAIMNPEEIRAAAKTLYGDAASDNEIKRNLSAALQVTERCVGKWLYGERKMSGPAVVLLDLLVASGSQASADPKPRRRRKPFGNRKTPPRGKNAGHRSWNPQTDAG